MNTKIILLTAFICLFSINTINSQTQEVNSVVEIQQDSNDAYYNLKYEHLDVLLRDETRLFKISVSPFKPSEKYDFSIWVLQLAYEKKMNEMWSGVAEINQNFIFGSNGTSLFTSLDFGMRRYLNKSMQIRRGTSGNNCNGLYAGGKISGIVEALSTVSAGYQNRSLQFAPKPELNIGIQHRINNTFYVDANAFMNHDLIYTNKTGFGINVLIGLAINADE